MSLQEQIIKQLGVKPSIDVQEEIRKRVNFLKQKVKKSRTTGLLIAISGGIDSAVAAALCQIATNELTEETKQPYQTLGVFQPYGNQEDIQDSYDVADAIGLQHRIEMNIEEAVDEIAIETEFGLKSIGVIGHLSKEGKGNIKARTRMVMQYALAFEMKLLVVGTDHASEAITGFYTKWGDGAVDVTPLSTLNKRQVRLLGTTLGIPERVVNKVPTAGLWAGQTDEKELGVTYEENSDYLEGKSIEMKAAEKLEQHYEKSRHKREPIPGI